MELKAFTGMANTASSETLPEGALVRATNVDIDDAGHIRRRRGTTLLDAGKYHSVWKSSEDVVYAVKDGDLCRFSASLVPTVIHSGVGTEKLHYVQVGQKIVAKNTSTSIAFSDQDSVVPWGVPHVPSMTLSTSAGVMPPGTYTVAATYARTTDGYEGGVSSSQFFVLSASGSIAVTLPALAGYTANVYVSAPNGEVLYRAVTGVGSTTQISAVPQSLGIPLRTEGKYPAPGKGPLSRAFGRVYIADGYVLWATDPFDEHVTMATGYKIFENRITFLAHVTAGAFVGTEAGIYFVKGPFETAQLIRLSTSGAPEQTPHSIDLAYVLKGEQQDVGVLFITDNGVCVGLADGSMINLTNKQFEFPKASEVSLMYRKQDGLNQFVGVSSHPGTPTGSARFGDFVDAEIIRHKEQ